MKIKEPLESIRESIHSIFSKTRKTVRENLYLVIVSLIQSESCNTSEIVQQMNKLTGNNFKANENRLSRFLDSSEFEVEDKLWRCFVKMIFKLLIERAYLKSGQIVPINVDFTTKKDEFLILSASIPFMGRAIPLYFSMRTYPKEKGKLDQKTMEKAFLGEL